VQVDKVALVFQQHAVLDCNLDFEIGRYCGEMVESTWTKDYWIQELDKSMAIVCTAAILQRLLASSYVKMNEINLLIFDECHHAKKNHPYARMIKDFYIREPNEADRPRILGMTASPVDAQTNVKYAAQELEAILFSEIATISEEMLSRDGLKPRHQEIRIMYPRLGDEFETPLFQKIIPQVRYNENFKNILAKAKRASRELGPWCADRFWQLALTNDEVARLTAKSERSTKGVYHSVRTGLDPGAAIKQVSEILEKHKFPVPEPNMAFLSAKVLRLREVLSDYFMEDSSNRCIVFVEQRTTARILEDVFQQPYVKLPHLRVAALVIFPILTLRFQETNIPQVGSQESGPSSMSFRDQIMNIIKFKRGQYNCLFSTSVGEEGLDIPDCNIIIRFDLFNSVIQYIQSRGRARHEDSKYIIMTEAGNSSQIRQLAQTHQDHHILQRFCAAMPEDRKIVGYDSQGAIMQKEFYQKQYVIQRTGATLNFSMAMGLLGDFVGSLPHSSEYAPRAEYLITTQGKDFVCEVMLPATSPIQAFFGPPQRTKLAARTAAAFGMCVELINKKYIDEHLRPTFTKKLPTMRNARLAISSNKKSEYSMRIKPDIWSRLGRPTELFATVIVLSNPDAVGRKSCPLILLSRESLPSLPAFPLFYGTGQKTLAKSVHVANSINVTDEDLDILMKFTFRIFDDVFSKEYEAEPSEVPYFLAPPTEGHAFDFSTVSDPNTIIDWDYIRSIRDIGFMAWDDDSPDGFFDNKFVIDPMSGMRKLFLRGIRKDMKPLDPVPDGVPDPGHKAWKIVEHNIKEYSFSGWAASRAKRTLRDDQPVCEAEVASLRRNLLAEFFEDQDPKRKVCFVILEPLCVSAVSLILNLVSRRLPC
jgi:endoribonuclease Dicer